MTALKTAYSNGYRTAAVNQMMDNLYTGEWHTARVIMDTIQHVELPKQSFDMLEHGGVGDGVTDNYQAIKALIAQAAAQGGGMIVFPKGTYLCNGPIHFQDNIVLNLVDADSKILFGTNLDDYLVGDAEHEGCILTSWEGTTLYNYSPAIYGYGCSNIGIIGEGTIDQQATEHWFQWRKNQKPDRLLTRKVNNDNWELSERIFGKKHLLRPHMIQLIRCEKILIQGVTLKDAGFWMVHLVDSAHAIVDGIKFKSNNLNNDGVDPESSKYVWIKNIDFDNGDDNISIKSGRDYEGIHEKEPCSHILVQNCRFKSHNAMAIGSEISGGANNIYVEDCSYGGAVKSALYLKSNRDRGGVTEKIYMRNLSFGECENAIRIITNYKNENTHNRIPKFKHIVLENIYMECVRQKAIEIIGLADEFVDGVVLKNVFVNSNAEVDITYCKNLSMDNVWIDGALCTVPESMASL